MKDYTTKKLLAIAEREEQHKAEAKKEYCQNQIVRRTNGNKTIYASR